MIINLPNLILCTKSAYSMEEGDILARSPSNGSLSAAAAAPELQRWSTLIVENKHRPFKFDARLRPLQQKKNKKKNFSLAEFL